VTCADDHTDWPGQGVLFDNADGGQPTAEGMHFALRRGVHRLVLTGPSIDNFRPPTVWPDFLEEEQ
jgi:hypothetical protein